MFLDNRVTEHDDGSWDGDEDSTPGANMLKVWVGMTRRSIKRGSVVRQKSA